MKDLRKILDDFYNDDTLFMEIKQELLARIEDFNYVANRLLEAVESEEK